MTFGFPAYHEEVLTVHPELQQHLWSIFASLGWRGSPTPDGKWIGTSEMSLTSWGERIAVQWVAEGQLHVRSECSVPTQCIDWGRNRENVEKLRRALGV